MNMSIPAFPSQELAKLVLGYLAEEQLMTAYDEFLQASPYLDAHSNEYDRIFMTSLRNILAEYRAVKICVETCKPISLRKKIFQCPNLLEIVKFLIHNSNVSENGVQETTTDKLRRHKNVLSFTRSATCDVCHSLRLTSCMCMPSNTAETKCVNLKNNSGETTPLSDLPGSHVKPKQTITKPTETNTLSSSFGGTTESDSYSSKLNIVETDTEAGDTSETVQSVPAHSNLQQESCETPNLYSANNKHTTPESVKLEEFNKILDFVSTQNESINKKTFSHNLGLSEVQKQVTGAENFQVFSSGITGGDKGKTVIVPDSSTSDHGSLQEPANKNPSYINQVQVSQCGKKRVIKRQYLLKVATVDNNTICKVNNEFVDSSNVINTSQNKDDPKITILSDVKVDNAMPAVLKCNATSTPLMQMQTLMINGTPVYRQLPNVAAPTTNYTKDEIMAMPTIILMPASAPPGAVTNTLTSSFVSRVNAPIQSVEPLIIDISPERPKPTVNTAGSVNSNTLEAQKEVNDSKMTETAELTVKNATAPKDESGISKTSTPHVLPPKRKSSSTPRRSSHIRVLDFATPRRILHEAINERPSLEEEVILSQSPNVAVSNNVVDNIPFTSNNKEKGNNNTDLSLKENCNTSNNKNMKKRNWDADLRVLAIASPLDVDKICNPKPQIKRKIKTKSKDSCENQSRKVKKSNKKNKNKSKFLENELIVIDDTPTETEINEAIVNKTTPNPERIIKPTINIVPGNDWSSAAAPDSDKSQNKSACNDTPEIDRLSLHNAIDSKLNISELLETPYKQAFYDIQMGTPRFLGPDLPDGEPMSDIKIMNIPTPRFLTTPKPVQATPGSYSSRPTDYSSGGSYYKPDDMDFVPTIDCQIISSNNDTEKSGASVSGKSKDSDTDKPINTKSSRPTRKCAKNVSYYNISMGKSKETDDKSSTCSENVSNTSLLDNIKESKQSKGDRNRRPSVKIKSSVPKTTKSPVKKVTPKSVIQRKAKVSLTKTSSARRIRTSASSRRNSSKPSPRKRTNSKEKQVTPLTMAVPTKSRRKSSTPRKLDCSEQFNSAASEQDETKNKLNKKVISLVTDSEAIQTPFRWSDDCSHDSSTKNKAAESNDTDDISKIKEFILTSDPNKSDFVEPKSSTQEHLIKRGFDAETAKIIERDLLDLRPELETNICVTSDSINNVEEGVVSSSHELKSDIKDDKATKDTIKKMEPNISSDTVNANLDENVDNDDEFDEIELSVHECNEDTKNLYRSYNFDENKDFHVKELTKLKDTYSMEVCIDEHVSIRLRATTFNTTLDLEPQEIECYDYSYRETVMAVNSISNMDNLYTPMKARARCVELFDSTLTSLDTPLKCADQHEHESTVTDIVLEVERVDEWQNTKKRKRQTDELNNESKKPKKDDVLDIPNMNDQDIENVLTKLHGP